MTRFRLPAVLCLLALVGASWIVPALADPPPWAPAHGWRDKHDRDDDDGDDREEHHRRHRDDDDRRYRGYTGYGWRDDYGVRSGHCNTDKILAAVGAAGGAIIGNRTSSPENQVVATILGGVIGGVVGWKIGDAIDDRDRACIGHSLELAERGRDVVWRNPRTGVDYRVRPTRDLGDGCREFELAAGRNGRPERMRACRGREGWDIDRR
jgi:surface antigen